MRYFYKEREIKDAFQYQGTYDSFLQLREFLKKNFSLYNLQIDIYKYSSIAIEIRNPCITNHVYLEKGKYLLVYKEGFTDTITAEEAIKLFELEEKKDASIPAVPVSSLDNFTEEVISTLTEHELINIISNIQEILSKYNKALIQRKRKNKFILFDKLSKYFKNIGFEEKENIENKFLFKDDICIFICPHYCNTFKVYKDYFIKDNKIETAELIYSIQYNNSLSEDIPKNSITDYIDMTIGAYREALEKINKGI